MHINCNKATVANQFQNYYTELKKNAGLTEFKVANRIYVQQSYKLNTRFQAVAEQEFGCGVQSLNFAAAARSAQIINNFVENETNGKIQNLMSPNSLNGDTRIVIVNAIFIKGKWERKFPKENTRSGPFSTTEYATYMNTIDNFNYARLPKLDAKALEMRYANSSFSVVIILPNEGVLYRQVEQKLKTYDWRTITSQMRMQKVNVTMPKIKVNHEQNLNYILGKVCILL